MSLSKTLLSDRLANGNAGDFMVMAEFQTAGRGRLDRRWSAAPGTSILLTVVLVDPLADVRVGADDDVSPGLLLMGPLIGLSARSAISTNLGVDLALKWPNDLVTVTSGSVLEGRPAAPPDMPAAPPDMKVGGLLSEAVWPQATSGSSRGRPSVLVGIGINIDPAAVPPEASEVATALGALVDLESDPRLDVVAAIAQASADRLGRPSTVGLSAIRDEWVARCSTLGRRVHVQVPSADGEIVTLSGFATSISASGALCVRLDTGEEREFAVGDIVHARPERDDYGA